MLLDVLEICVVLHVVLKLILALTKGRAKSNQCLIGKTALVTGGNRGIGYETVLGLAARGCRVIIANRQDAENVKDEVIRLTNNPNIVSKRLDLASFKSVRELAEDVLKTEERLDILINNAGVAPDNQTITEDGNVRTMQINHLGPFLLTHLLIDLLKKTPGSRIVFVASILAFVNNLTVENINQVQTWRMFAYGNPKLCNIITAKIMAEVLKDSKIAVNSLHPGIANTTIFDYDETTRFYNLLHFFGRACMRFYGKTPREGAQTTLHVALNESCADLTGKYFMDCRVFVEPPKCSNREFCLRIFRKSEELAGLRPHEKLSEVLKTT